MVWNWPQITWAIIGGLALVVTAIQDGEPRKGKHSFANTAISLAVTAFILWQGGFWVGVRP